MKRKEIYYEDNKDRGWKCRRLGGRELSSGMQLSNLK